MRALNRCLVSSVDGASLACNWIHLLLSFLLLLIHNDEGARRTWREVITSSRPLGAPARETTASSSPCRRHCCLPASFHCSFIASVLAVATTISKTQASRPRTNSSGGQAGRASFVAAAPAGCASSAGRPADGVRELRSSSGAGRPRASSADTSRRSHGSRTGSASRVRRQRCLHPHLSLSSHVEKKGRIRCWRLSPCEEGIQQVFYFSSLINQLIYLETQKIKVSYLFEILRLNKQRRYHSIQQYLHKKLQILLCPASSRHNISKHLE